MEVAVRKRKREAGGGGTEKAGPKRIKNRSS